MMPEEKDELLTSMPHWGMQVQIDDGSPTEQGMGIAKLPWDVTSPDDFKAAMEGIRAKYQEIQEDGGSAFDASILQAEADQLIVGLLRSLGYSEAMDVYDQMVKWYA